MTTAIGIVGMGFVGTAVAAGFTNERTRVVVADPRLGTTVQDVLEEKPEAVIVCVPTPMNADCKIDTSIVAAVLQELQGYAGLVVVKSTITPSGLKALSAIRDFVYNPEFLTEANAADDFVHPPMHVFGGCKADTNRALFLYENFSNCLPCRVIHCSHAEASMIKYGINSFLALKVMFFNQLSDLCGEVGADYSAVKTAMQNDVRVGSSHMNVPGHDGRRGFGSACFSKDVPAIVHESIALGVEQSVLREAWNSNCQVRNEYLDLLPREIDQHVTFTTI